MVVFIDVVTHITVVDSAHGHTKESIHSEIKVYAKICSNPFLKF